MKYLFFSGVLLSLSFQVSAVEVHISPEKIAKLTGKAGVCAQEMSGGLTSIVYLKLHNNDDVHVSKMEQVAPAKPDRETYRVTFALGNHGDGEGLSFEDTYLVNFDSRCRMIDFVRDGNDSKCGANLKGQ